MRRRTFFAGLAAIIVVAVTPSAHAGNAKRALARRAWQRIFARDAARDAATPAKPLKRSRRVWRYTTKRDAENTKRHGLPKGRHMTSGTSPGRPPSPSTARDKYGLPRKPEARITIELPKGHPVRHNKVVGGKPGVGEITSVRRVPNHAIKKITPLNALEP